MASNTRSIIQNYPNPKFKFFFSFTETQDLEKCKTLKIFVQARCISDVKADTDHTSFITGTLSLKEENEVYIFCPNFEKKIWSQFVFFGFLNQWSFEVVCFRCIWFGFHQVEPSSYARVCSRTRTRSGTSLPVPSINGSSPLSTLLVFDFIDPDPDPDPDLFYLFYLYIIKNLIRLPRCLLNNAMHSFGWFVSTF